MCCAKLVVAVIVVLGGDWVRRHRQSIPLFVVLVRLCNNPSSSLLFDLISFVCCFFFCLFAVRCACCCPSSPDRGSSTRRRTTATQPYIWPRLTTTSRWPSYWSDQGELALTYRMSTCRLHSTWPSKGNTLKSSGYFDLERSSKCFGSYWLLHSG